ncbi:MAG: GH39 family glycosyl hydrolase, partial [Candidatus Binatia bacterium]
MRATAIAALVLLASVARSEPAPATIVVDAGTIVGSSNQKLTGVGWNTGSLAGIGSVEPHGVRIDASLETASTAEGVVDLDPLLARVAAVRAIGAEPLVILSYMPPWLGQSYPPFDPRDPSRTRPRDLGKWQQLIETVVATLAAADPPACRFEVWNEPDIPIFWQDSLTAFLDLALATHRAVEAVSRAPSRCPTLEVGGPATAFPDPAFMIPYLAAVRRAGLSLDFVSWHYYGNYPFLGPDGAEDILPPEILPAYPLIGRRNPLASPSSYAVQVEMVRGFAAAALAGSGYHPVLMIDEWNLSAGGYDLRNDTNEGAAFAAGVLIEMERSGLDQADFYRATDSPANTGRRGDWGLVDHTDAPKPTWWVFDAWRRTAGMRLSIGGDPSLGGLWARATSGTGSIDLLLASFSAEGGVDRRITVKLAGACSDEAEVRTLATAGSDLASGEAVTLTGGALTVDAPKQSVVWVRFATV